MSDIFWTEFDGLRCARAAHDELLVKYLLSHWASEMEPAVAYRDGQIIGLTCAEYPVGVQAPIVVPSQAVALL